MPYSQLLFFWPVALILWHCDFIDNLILQIHNCLVCVSVCTEHKYCCFPGCLVFLDLWVFSWWPWGILKAFFCFSCYFERWDSGIKITYVGCGSGSVGKPLPGTGQSLGFLPGVASTNNESWTGGRMLGLLTLVTETQQATTQKQRKTPKRHWKGKGMPQEVQEQATVEG